MIQDAGFIQSLIWIFSLSIMGGLIGGFLVVVLYSYFNEENKQ